MMLMRWFFALLILSGVAFAQSQQPPSDSNPSTKEDTQQTIPPTKEEHPAPDRRATEIVPFTIQVAPTQKSKAETEKEERESGGAHDPSPCDLRERERWPPECCAEAFGRRRDRHVQSG